MCFAGVGGAHPTVVYRPTPITTRHGPTRKRVVQLYRLLRSCTTSKSPLSTRRCPHLLLSAGACCTAPAAALSDSFGCIGAINKFIYLFVYLSIYLSIYQLSVDNSGSQGAQQQTSGRRCCCRSTGRTDGPTDEQTDSGNDV